ncbi:HPr kinase/phosphatase C-terminal domain-containing protein [Roseobacter sp.]
MVHASCVSLDKIGVLITGASGQGKSGLALQLMAFGCDLVADDQTQVRRRGSQVLASAPLRISGLIEARGVGLLHAAHQPETRLHLVIDMGQREAARLPAEHTRDLLGVELPCLHKVDSPSFPAAILQYLKCGRAQV